MRLILKSGEYYELNNIRYIKLNDEKIEVYFNTAKGKRYKKINLFKKMVKNLDSVISEFDLNAHTLVGLCSRCGSENLYRMDHYIHYVPQLFLKKEYKVKQGTEVKYKCNDCGNISQDLNTTKTIVYYV